MDTSKPRVVSQSRAIRLPHVCDLAGVSRATIWRWVGADEGFPKPFHLSPAITCWDESEVTAWIEAKKRQRNKS